MSQHDNDQAKQDAVILLTGYLRGLWSRFGEDPEPMAVSCLKTLGCPEQFLPVLPEGQTRGESEQT